MVDEKKAPSQTYPKPPEEFTVNADTKAPEVLDTKKGAALIKH